MPLFNRLTAAILTAVLVVSMAPLSGKTRKGDRYLNEGRAHEARKEWDAALEAYEQALAEDPSDVVYQMGTERARFQASQAHVAEGLRLRSKGLLGEALAEFQKAYQID